MDNDQYNTLLVDKLIEMKKRDEKEYQEYMKVYAQVVEDMGKVLLKVMAEQINKLDAPKKSSKKRKKQK